MQDLNVADEGSSSISEGVSESLPRSEGEVSAPDDAPALAPRRSSRRIPVRAAVLKYKRLLHVIHKHLPIRLTKRRKDGSIVLVSKAKVIQKYANRIEPASMKKALAGEHAKEWKEAMEAEHKSLEENKTFLYVQRSEVPKGQKIIKSLYVLKLATHADGTAKKYKVRLVARGDLQDPTTYNETYASTCQRKAVMLLLSIANQRNWEIATADISTAFLYGDLDEPIYMEIPDGRIVKLLKSLYGLKQAAFKFKEHLDAQLRNIGFKRLDSDSSIYQLTGKRSIILTSHVDDLLMLGALASDVKWVHTQLSKVYNMTFEPEATEYLGYTFLRDRNLKTLKLNQLGNIVKLLDNFPPKSMTTTPRTPYCRITVITEKDEELLSPEDVTKYQQITGSLLYVSICTRADLLYAVHMLTRRMSSPRVLDMRRAKKAVAYLMGTPHLGVTFHATDEEEIFGWADSGFNSGEGDRKNHYGYCFQMGKTSGMFVNICKRSTLIAQSSTEAEYYCLAEACRELLWINSFLTELSISIPCKTIYQDNTTTIAMATHDGVTARSKHIDLKFQFIKRLYLQNIVTFPHQNTKGMIADIFTKDLVDTDFESHVFSVLGEDPESYFAVEPPAVEPRATELRSSVSNLPRSPRAPGSE